MASFSAKCVRAARNPVNSVRYVKYEAPNASTAAALDAVMRIPRIGGNRFDWTVIETVKCDDLMRRTGNTESYVKGLTDRLIRHIIVGDYAQGYVFPPRAVIGDRLGLLGSIRQLDHAITRAEKLGYIDVDRKSRRITVNTHDKWAYAGEVESK